MKLRHKTTTAVIGGTQWNEDHTRPRHALGDLPAAVTLDLANGSVQSGTVVGNTAITLPAIPAGMAEHLTLFLTNDDTGPDHAITVQGDTGVSFTWAAGAAPALDGANLARNVLVFTGTDTEGWVGDGASA